MPTNQTQQQLDPLAQLVTKYQSNGQQPGVIQPPSPLQKKEKTRTGFADKTLWDWLNLAGVLLVPLMIGVFTITTTLQQSQISQQQFQNSLQLSQQQYSNSQKLADDQQKEDVLVNYQKDISDLLLNYKLGSAKEDDPISIVARTKTLTALRRLDPNRKAALLQFLYEAKLIGSVQLIGNELSRVKSRDPAIVNMLHADLSQVNMGDAANLEGVDLSGANLNGANLFKADLKGARVTKKQLARARTLKGTILPDGSTYPSQSYPIPNHVEPSLPQGT